MNLKKIFIIILVILVAATVFFVLTRGNNALNASDFNIPAGWYAHTMSNGNILLTHQKDLPNIGAFEGFAYGEQIAISSIALDRPIEDWINQRIPADDPIYMAKERGVLDGYQTLRVEHEVEAAGKVLDYYLFANNRVYMFSLYPLELTNASGKTVRNTTDVKILEHLVRDYSSKL